MRLTKNAFPAKCNSGRIALQWFHIMRYLDYQYTKFQLYTFRVQKMCFSMIREFGSPTTSKAPLKFSPFECTYLGKNSFQYH